MQALQLESFGMDGLHLRDLPIPVPGRGQVLVKVHAAALNPADLLVIDNLLGPAVPSLPATVGMDMAGVIAACGEGVEDWHVGEAVYACAGGVRGRPGTLAEYSLADTRSLARLPSGLTMREAAALALTGITAWEGLLDRAQLQAGETVLIQGGTGGVGYLAAQLARHRGARVFATASTPARQAILEAIGVQPVAYRELSPAEIVARYTEGRGFDVVYDCAGKSALEASLAAVRPYGRVISCSAWGPADLAPLLGRSASLTGIFMLLPLLTGEGLQRHGEILQALARLAAEKTVRPLLDAGRYRLADAPQALRTLAAGRHTGKLVIDIIP